MTHAYDLVVRGGTVVDGSGAPQKRADVAVLNGRIAAVEQGVAAGREEIDARGKIVTPGFVDVHTHYDGQITWEERLRPSSDHGVTTVVMGNCGVGFAPCKADDRKRLIAVMEGVEDIPEVVMAEGLTWNWETFGDYLDVLEGRRSDVDFAAQLPHSALRVFVMGERGAELEPPTGDDLSRMEAIAEQAVLAGALGVSTSRSLNHRRKDGVLAPSVPSEKREVEALARGLGKAGRGVFQIIPNNEKTPEEEFALIRRLAEISGRPVSFSLMDWPHKPGDWQIYLDLLGEAVTAGMPIKAQTYTRPVGALYGLNLSFHPFSNHPSFQAIRDLPLAQKVAAMRDPSLRDRLLSEEPDIDNSLIKGIYRFETLYLMKNPVRYNPQRSDSVAACAMKAGVSPYRYIYDRMMDSDGAAIFYHPGANFVGGNLDNVRAMMTHKDAIYGLGDGGAHYGIICDASHPTFTLSYWVRDVEADRRVSLEWAVASLSRKPALAMGLEDRGLLVPGYKADLNVIDMDKIALDVPRPVYDLPSNGRRLLQPARGYEATVVSGQVTYRSGGPTGALPGRLIRSH